MTKANLAKNTTYYTAALTFQKILSFIYFWYISNNLFAGDLGQYVFALSFTTLFSIFVDLGLSPILTREAAKETDSANSFLRNVLGLKIPLSILTLIAAWVVISITGKSPEIRLLVYLASIIMVLDSFSLSFWVIFRARQNMFYESIGTIIIQLIIFILGIIAVKTTGQVKYLMLGLLVASIFNFCLVIALLKTKLKFSLTPKLDPKVIKQLLKIVPAFALAGIFIKIYNTSDSVLLGYLDSDIAVGFFAVPAKVVYALQQVIPAAFAAVIFPAFSFYYANSKTLLKLTFEKAFNYLTIISLPICGGILVLIPEIIDRVWPKYTPVIPTFYAMTLAIPFIFLAFPTGYLLNSCDRQNNTTINRGIITALAVILNIVLIPQISYFGAGITFFITNFVLLFLDFYWVKKIIDLNYSLITKIIIKSLLATATMVIIVYLTKPYLNLLLVVPLGGLVYFLVLYLVKGFSLDEAKDLIKKGLGKPNTTIIESE
jgi:O-antigen/teichoic acid export membrane protein